MGEVAVIRILLNEVYERERGDLPGLTGPDALGPAIDVDVDAEADVGAVWAVMGSGRSGGVFGECFLWRGRVIVSISLNPVRLVGAFPLLLEFEAVAARGPVVEPPAAATGVAPDATLAAYVEGPGVERRSRKAARSVWL